MSTEILQLTIQQSTITLLSTIISAILSALLVVLYWRQTNIQKNQEELMERQYKPDIALGHSADKFPQLLLRNLGGGAASNIHLQWEILGRSHESYIPFLKPGGEVSVILSKEEGGRATTLLEIEQLQREASKRENPQIKFSIEYEDGFGEIKRFHREQPLDPIIERLANFSTKTEDTEIQEVADRLYHIDDSLNDIRKVIDSLDDDEFGPH